MKLIGAHEQTRARYVVALAVVAVLSVATFVVGQWRLTVELGRYSEINIAGRQRMLSQRITLLSQAMTIVDDHERDSIRDELLEAAALMEGSHTALLRGDPDLRVPGHPSTQVRALLFEPPMRLDAQVLGFLAAARSLANASSAELGALQRQIAASAPLLLETLDGAVTQYVRDSRRVKRAHGIYDAAALAVMIVAIALLGVWLFRPMVHRVRQDTETLDTLTRSLEHQVAERTQALRQSEEAEQVIERLMLRNQLILDSVMQGIIGVDLESTVTFVNPAAAKLAESTAVEMLGQPAATLLNDSDAPAESSLSDLIRRAIEEGEPQRAEFDLRGGKRTYFPARVVAVPVQEENEITGAVVVFEDVTEHRRSEGALRRSETNYRALVDNAAYGIYRSSLEGKLLSVNPALVEMLGYDSAAELMAVDMARDLYTDSTERQRLIETLGQEELFRVETTWRKKDGKTIAVTLSDHRIVDEAGAIVGYEGIVEDVTERRQLEAQLRQAQKLEAVGQLTGGIAHDFNNVLTVIIANAELAKSSGLDHAELLDYVQEIERAAHGASTTVKRLLGFGRKADLNMVPANLTEIVNNLSPMLRTVTPESIELSIDGDDAVASAKADAGAVEQMIINLVNNAKDAMPKGGSLRVEVANAELDERHREFRPWIVPGRCVCISVSDTGEGMDEETKNRIFEPFYTTKPVGVGTGLGMAMVYGLMKQHGGFVHVYSEVSHGTTVKLYFPAVREAARRSTIKTPLPEEILHGSETILLVEDQDDVRRTGRRVLQRFGYNVLVAVNGEEALEIYHAHDGIDLIVSDLVMPKMGGRELYQALSQENPAVKFILSSGYREQDAIQRAEMTDELPFLEKPWSVPELVGKVREVLDADDPASVGETED